MQLGFLEWKFGFLIKHSKEKYEEGNIKESKTVF